MPLSSTGVEFLFNCGVWTSIDVCASILRCLMEEGPGGLQWKSLCPDWSTLCWYEPVRRSASMMTWRIRHAETQSEQRCGAMCGSQVHFWVRNVIVLIWAHIWNLLILGLKSLLRLKKKNCWGREADGWGLKRDHPDINQVNSDQGFLNQVRDNNPVTKLITSCKWGAC